MRKMEPDWGHTILSFALLGALYWAAQVSGELHETERFAEELLNEQHLDCKRMGYRR